jgi:hypothetical protein
MVARDGVEPFPVIHFTRVTENTGEKTSTWTITTLESRYERTHSKTQKYGRASSTSHDTGPSWSHSGGVNVLSTLVSTQGCEYPVFICDSQDLALHSVMSDGVATVRQTLGWGRRDCASLCKRLVTPNNTGASLSALLSCYDIGIGLPDLIISNIVCPNFSCGNSR